MPQATKHIRQDSPSFAGYPAPESNVTYTPNQFFDVVLLNASRGAVRLVAYMIRKTLGWCDANGNPQEQQVLVSYQHLEANAGISRGAIKKVLEECIAAGYLTCVRQARPKTAGEAGWVSALYELRWDLTGEYVSNPHKFSGFYASGDGNRTNIPNAFFDYTVKYEPLSVVKVVGAIIRHTIGWQTVYGFRRQQVEMSFTQLERRTKLSRKHLNTALQYAIAHGHLFRTAEGFFDPNAGKASRAAVYALKWADNAAYPEIGSKRIPEKISEIGEDRFKKDTGIGSKRIPEDRFKKDTDIEIKQENKTSQIKQQQPDENPLAVVVHPQREILETLIQQGFNHAVAKRLANSHPAERVLKQINWLGKRNPNRNRLGMLRRAIEENWAEPVEEIPTLQSSQSSLGAVFAAHFYAGRAGNDGTPVASPSSKDLQEAEAFVQRLLTLWPDETKVAEWGRDFGVYVRQTELHNERAIVSFVVSLRSHGDEFYRQHRDRKAEADRRAQALAQEDHLEQHYPTYLEHLKAREVEFQRRQPERYERWLNRFLNDPFTFSVQKSEEGRLRAFAKVAKLPDFWEWDEQTNPESFTRKRVAV
jgi:hypothetical protein